MSTSTRATTLNMEKILDTYVLCTGMQIYVMLRLSVYVCVCTMYSSMPMTLVASYYWPRMLYVYTYTDIFELDVKMQLKRRTIKSCSKAPIIHIY